MIKMRYEELKESPFQQAIQKLASMPMKTPEAFRVKHIIQGLQKNLEDMQKKVKSDILAPYAKGGAESRLPPGPKSQEFQLFFEAIEGKEEEAKKALDAFGKREFTLSFKKIRGDFLLSVGEWSVAELIALEPIVSDLAVAEETGTPANS